VIQAHPQPTHEYFARYETQRWHAAQPLIVLHQHYPRGKDTGAWQHMDFYALYVVRAGRGIHRINEHPYAIRRGDVYITPPGSVHRYCDFDGLQAIAFCFQAQLFADDALDALSELPGFQNLFVRGQAGPKTNAATQDYQRHLSPNQYDEIDALVENILREIQQATPDIASPLIVRDLMFRLLTQLARYYADQRQAPASSKPAPTPGLAEVLHVCETRFTEDLTVPQLAALMFLSPSHFTEVFAREVGTPPATYLRQLRLAHAQHLLSTTQLSITAIAQQCGFNDSAQFARAFKAVFGHTPREHRTKN